MKNKIIPAPKHCQWENAKEFSSGFPLNVKSDLDFQAAFDVYADFLNWTEEDVDVILHLDQELHSHVGDEGYVMEVGTGGIMVQAATKAGIFYGVQSLLQLLPLTNPTEDFSIPIGKIEDVPSYGWRGFMFDEARHFFGMAIVKRILDWMATYKLNRFHWHLTDDQGWRVAINAFPNLTTIGARRNGSQLGPFFSLGKGEYVDQVHQGFYTQEEIKEIVRYAKARHIEVIPEFDLPGHFSAVLAAYPEFGCTGEPVAVKEGSGIYTDIACVGNPQTIDFIKTVIDELCNLFPFPYFHIGGDEVKKDHWKTCPKCQRLMEKEGIDSLHNLQVYLTNQITAYLKEKGRTALVWNEALGPSLDPDVMLIHWISTGKHFRNTMQAMQDGRKVLMQPIFTTYFDYSYALVPIRKINQFDERKGMKADAINHLVGVQSALWTEQVMDEAHVQFNCFPKLALMAETGWGTRVDDDGSDFLRRWQAGKPQQTLLGLTHAAPLAAVNPRGLRRWLTALRCMLIDMRYEMKRWR